MFPKMAEIVKPAKVGVAEVTHYTVTKLDVLRELMHGGPCEEGTVAILRVNGMTMMSDTRHERLTNWEFYHQAKGNVLIAGLGLGIIVHGILDKNSVKSVTVIEKEMDVIKLIRPTLPKNKSLSIIHADIFDWKPEQGALYDCIYFDIWANASDGRATPDRRKLSGRFKKYKAEGAWMGSWHCMDCR